MAGVVRLGDYCDTHGCFPSRPSVSASHNFFVNNKAAHRVGDKWAVHCCTCCCLPHGCHDGTAQEGSKKFFVNGKAIFRKGDPVNCGSKGGECSHNFFVYS